VNEVERLANELSAAGDYESLVPRATAMVEAGVDRDAFQAALVGFANLAVAFAVGAGVIWGAAVWFDSWWMLVLTVPIAVSLFGLVAAALGSQRINRAASRRG
jgi:hypothetical protein